MDEGFYDEVRHDAKKKRWSTKKVEVAIRLFQEAIAIAQRDERAGFNNGFAGLNALLKRCGLKPVMVEEHEPYNIRKATMLLKQSNPEVSVLGANLLASDRRSLRITDTPVFLSFTDILVEMEMGSVTDDMLKSGVFYFDCTLDEVMSVEINTLVEVARRCKIQGHRQPIRLILTSLMNRKLQLLQDTIRQALHRGSAGFNGGFAGLNAVLISGGLNTVDFFPDTGAYASISAKSFIEEANPGITVVV